jgi:hypothetical protein
MKKTFILAAMAAAVALGFTACGSDDDDYVAPKRDVVLDLPTNAQNAVAFEDILDDDAAPFKSKDGAKILEGITFTETGNAVAEIDGDYVVGKYTAKDGIYTMTGNIRGTVKTYQVTKGTSSVDATIEIDFTIIINGQEYNFSGDADANKQTATELTKNNDLNNVCRKWNFKDMGLTLYGDVSMSKTYTTGDLSQLGKDANDNGAGLTIDELGKLNKTIVSFEFTKSGKLYLTYKENGKEVAECASWDSKNFEDFTINEISDANKFIKDGSKIKVVYNGAGGCTLTFYTKIGDKSKGEKVYEAYLTVNLTEAAN